MHSGSPQQPDRIFTVRDAMDTAVENDHAWMPHEITADSAGTKDLVGWLTALGPDPLNDMLIERKALVFRGFGVDPGSIETVFDKLVPGRLPYVHGNSPRTKVGGNLYTSTEYPQQFTISMHNEMAYAHRWPS